MDAATITDIATQSATGGGVLGVVTGGVGVAFLAKYLFKRMIDGYDRRHDEHAKKIEEHAAAATAKLEAVTEKLQQGLTRVAVLEAVLEDARRLRVEVENRVSGLRGEVEAKHSATVEDVNDLRSDVYVAHERIRMLSRGDNNIEAVKKPERIKRR